MSSEVVLRAHDLSKCYRVYQRPLDRLLQALDWRKHHYYREFWALHKLSLELRSGETLGIIGRNGSGKSTLLQLLCGTLKPTTGSVEVYGRIAALLELGSGFNPEFTGRENAYLNGAILGIPKSEMRGLIEEIAEFADIGEFFDQPMKTYSSGMFVRVAFSVQAAIVPDVLIVDEALSVGDIFFQQKCHERMESLIRQGTAVIVVSHDMRAIEKYCSRVLLLDGGICIGQGIPSEMIRQYFAILERPANSLVQLRNPSAAPSAPAGETFSDVSRRIADWPKESAFLGLQNGRYAGDTETAVCTRIALMNDAGQPAQAFKIGEMATFFTEFEILRDIEVPIAGVAIIDAMSVTIHSKASLHYQVPAPDRISANTRVRFRQSIGLSIAPGEYTFVILFATMSASDYAAASTLQHQDLMTRVRGIFRLMNVGRFLVVPRSEGLAIPFMGQVDLPGMATCDLDAA